jgi:hypothetical protein
MHACIVINQHKSETMTTMLFCVQDAVERGWLRESRSCLNGPVNLLAVLATAATLFPN